MSEAALLRLMTWLSPAFPVGGFSYSHGLETAAQERLVTDVGTLTEWIGDLITTGSAWTDSVLFAQSWRQAEDMEQLRELADLAAALAGSHERFLETTALGTAFQDAVAAWPEARISLDGISIAYPVVAGSAAARGGVELLPALTAWLQAFVSSQVQAALRLLPIGQTGGLTVTAALEPVILQTAERGSQSSLDDLGSATIAAEIAAMRHERQPSRIFRS